MISPTLLGKLKNSRAIRIKWCGTEPYALARSSQITCSSVLSLLPDVLDIQVSQVSQPSGHMYLYNDCLSEKLSYDEQELQKIFSLLHLGEILGENLWYFLTAFPLVSKYDRPNTIPVVQYPSSKPAEGGQWVSWGHVGSFYITCTISHSSPGHYLRGIGIPFKSSEYVIFKWFSNSSFGTSRLPLFDSTKSLFANT